MKSFWAAGATIAATLGGAACSNDIVVVDGSGGAASATVVTVTSAGGAGGAGQGGFGGRGGAGGAAPREPVPGCEALVAHEELVTLAGLKHPDFVGLAPYAADQAAILYIDHDSGDGVYSQTLSDPYGAWPPPVGDIVEVAKPDFLGNVYRPLTWRSDGTFAVTLNGTGRLGTFGVPGVADVSDGQLWLAPEPATGAVASLWNPGGTLRFYAEAAPGAAFVDVAQPYTDGDCEGNVLGFAGDGSFVIAHGPRWDCHRGPSTHTVYAVKDGVVSTWPSVDVPFTPRQWRSDIFPAANGGAWLAPTGAPQADATIIGLGPNGGASVRLLGDGDAMHEPVYGAWRGGVVVARRSVDESGPVFAVAVTDGVHETKLVGIPAPWSFVEPPPAVASSPDGSSLLLAYPYFDGDDDGLAVVRVDCVAAD